MRHMAKCNSSVSPAVDEAVCHYTSLGGVLTEPHPFGRDRLDGYTLIPQIRCQLFEEKCPSFDAFPCSVNRITEQLPQCLSDTFFTQ